MIAISCNNVTKSFGIDLILEDISFTINIGDKVGLIGKNGTGKSTLFRILTNQSSYDKGNIYISKDLNIGYLKQNLSFDNEKTIFEECLTVFEDIIEMEKKIRNLEYQISKTTNHEGNEFKNLMNLYSNLLDEFNNKNGYGYKSEIRGVLKGLGFSDEDFEKEIMKLSGGQKSRLNIAKLLLQKPNILLLDEPTNHLDIDAINWLEGFLKNYSGTLLVISHDRYFLDQISNKVFEIENKNIVQFEGSYTKYIDYKKSMYKQQMKQYLQQQKEIAKQEEIIRRFKQHGTEKLANRAKSRERRLEKINVLDKPIINNHRTQIKFQSKEKSGREVLKVNALSKSFDNQTLFQNISFNIYRNERVALIGPNGIGKTTLFKILLNKLNYDSGDIVLGHNVFIGYYDQEQENLNPNNNLIDEICNENPKISIPEARNLLAAFLFTGDDVFKEVGNLSGGEKSRLSLLKLMLSSANFILLDEPTNHLDLPSKEVLEDALLEYDGTIFTISHDRYFLNKIATKILEISQDGIKEYLGNYDYYIEKKKQLEQSTDDKNSETITKTKLKEEKKRKKIEEAEKKKHKQMIKELEDKILDFETRLNELEHLMCDKDVYANPDKSKQLHNEYENIKRELENLYSQWEEKI
ncbi:ABC-F family ATP-binding cassette domain-containing protein [Paramaledivibacter caminithermalis]|jgi:ATP-binding cassette subfamily F protein 3|uniref:ATP-binding cassette, subfamily F, member 3 n=1 Tax=Paramaledivibacter caminithermalis (strain DSM 15212 / CIP 107654 / DViRD3) TaxID=1121301 RepID=A0A1M6L919_PARC5|nr:ABC-F family ATP-binding cassette domain-containing protein [Paramaledivibacter caminithermalis]SHJ67665.1 ATP-binding cassette, subfamily F, member 3 [Paramaledivibacter caminithermalis DSM 15212]